MIVAILGTGPCQADVNLNELIANRPIATLNGAIQRVPHAQWAFMQEPNTVDLFACEVSDGTCIVIGHSVETVLAENPTPEQAARLPHIDRVRFLGYRKKPGSNPCPRRDRVRAAMEGKSFQIFDQPIDTRYPWYPRELKRLDWCPLDVSLVFALAYFADFAELMDIEEVELYGIDMNRTHIRGGRPIKGGGDCAGLEYLERILKYYPLTVTNCCPTSAFKLVPGACRVWTRGGVDAL